MERIITPNDKKYRSTIGKLRVLSAGDEYITDVSLDLLDSRTNRNNWKYENLEEHLKQFYRKPLLVAYKGTNVDGSPKFGGHSFKYAYDDETGEVYCSFLSEDAEKMVGIAALDDGDVKLEQRGSDTWITATGVIYEWYAHELVSMLKKKQSRGMDVSIETLVIDGYIDPETGTEHITKYIVLGVTLLGEGIIPAVEGANIKTLSEVDEELKKFMLRAASYRNLENEPHKNLNPKRSEHKTMEVYSKHQANEFASIFNGYTVLAAGKDEYGIHVALLSADGVPYTYTADTLETFVPSKLERKNVSAQYKFGDDCTLSVDVMEITAGLCENAKKVISSLEETKKELRSAIEKVGEMKAAESKRRINAATETARETLRKFNECRREQIDNSEIEKLNAEIKKGAFTNSVNENGEWIGCQEVEDRVFAICGRKIAEAGKKDYVSWGIANNNAFEPQTFGEYFKRGRTE